jgi:GNAT superfamily N-acetyltransferase
MGTSQSTRETNPDTPNSQAAVRVRRGVSSDLQGLIRLTQSLAEETENGLVLHEEKLRIGIARGLLPVDVGGKEEEEEEEEEELSPKYWVAERQSDGRLVGFLAVSPEWSDWWATCYWWIISVFVEADSRRGKVATALFASMEADSAAAGVQTVNLRVESGNAGAQQFYKRIGFAEDPSHIVMAKGRKPDGQSIGAQ